MIPQSTLDDFAQLMLQNMDAAQVKADSMGGPALNTLQINVPFMADDHACTEQALIDALTGRGFTFIDYDVASGTARFYWAPNTSDCISH